MGETCPVTLSLDLPVEVAAKLEEMQRADPEVLSRGIRYLVLRKQIFDLLAAGAAHRPAQMLT